MAFYGWSVYGMLVTHLVIDGISYSLFRQLCPEVIFQLYL